VHDALGHAAHQFRLNRQQRRLGSASALPEAIASSTLRRKVRMRERRALLTA
jgi:hypothetical protein